MNATRELSVNCGDSTGKEKISFIYPLLLWRHTLSWGQYWPQRILPMWLSVVCRCCIPSCGTHCLYSPGFGVASLRFGSSCLASYTAGRVAALSHISWLAAAVWCGCEQRLAADRMNWEMPDLTQISFSGRRISLTGSKQLSHPGKGKFLRL